MERLLVSAPILLARLELRQFPGRLTGYPDPGAACRPASLNELFAKYKAMLRVGLPVYVEREMDERTKALLARLRASSVRFRSVISRTKVKCRRPPCSNWAA